MAPAITGAHFLFLLLLYVFLFPTTPDDINKELKEACSESGHDLLQEFRQAAS
jgi:hypothetical protein